MVLVHGSSGFPSCSQYVPMFSRWKRGFRRSTIYNKNSLPNCKLFCQRNMSRHRLRRDSGTQKPDSGRASSAARARGMVAPAAMAPECDRGMNSGTHRLLLRPGGLELVNHALVILAVHSSDFASERAVKPLGDLTLMSSPLSR